ncbi:hypothetical protein ACFGZH_03555 [Pasteurella multocida]|nr:hypothetical protein [Pasteurella multocida]
MTRLRVHLSYAIPPAAPIKPVAIASLLCRTLNALFAEFIASWLCLEACASKPREAFSATPFRDLNVASVRAILSLSPAPRARIIAVFLALFSASVAIADVNGLPCAPMYALPPFDITSALANPAIVPEKSLRASDTYLGKWAALMPRASSYR